NAANSANSAALGGVPASGYVQGSGRITPVRGYVADSGPTVTLIDVPGVGKMTLDCTSSGNTVILTYRNMSGATQIGVESVAPSGAPPPSTVTAQSLANGNPFALSGTGNAPSRGAVFTFDFAPIDPTGAPGFSFRGSGYTQMAGLQRCAASGVVTIG